MKENTWYFSTQHNAPCKVIETQTLWGETFCRIWLPGQETVVRVAQSSLQTLQQQQVPAHETHRITYLAAAAKVAEILEDTQTEGKTLLAPMEANVIPLPHQLQALSRAISGNKIRYLLADEVGLGKTIEAGLILRELKLRGLVQRTLVVAPKSLAMQWTSEMQTHFNEKFVLVNPSDLDALTRLDLLAEDETAYQNPWLRFSQAIVTLDSVKPVTRRKGWSKDKIRSYNLNRYDNLIQGNWDLIIVDEAHRLGGSTDQVARFKLGQGLSESAPYLLLLSATPHQGKSDAFQRLMSLLDAMSFPDLESIQRDKVGTFTIRTEKRKAVDAQGNPLFKPRTTRTESIDLNENPLQLELYEQVTAYVKKGYNQAIQDRKPHIGFLMVLLQRIVSSSTYAIRCTLERRLNVLEELQNPEEAKNSKPETLDLEELSELDSQEQLDNLIEINEPGRQQEMTQVKFLMELAQQVENAGPDIKAQAILDLIYRLQGEENEDQLKLLIFTEFVPTQEMLAAFLEQRGITCCTLNGSMNMDERRIAQKEFRESKRVLISTDAGGEGLNLQFCHVVINYDLPWNPMRIEQRIGRVDRIGQDKIVRAINFAYADSVEARVREVLESKLALILQEMGIDKTSDVLDTSLSGQAVEQLMIHVLMQDANLESEVEQFTANIQQEMQTVKETSPIYGISDEPDLASAEAFKNHPLPIWLEQMTTHYLHFQGGKAEQNLLGWQLTWPDGTTMENIAFRSNESLQTGEQLTLEHPRLRGLALALPQHLPGQALSRLSFPHLPATVQGLWGLFEIRLQLQAQFQTQLIRVPTLRKKYLSLFINPEQKVFLPTARHIWDSLLTEDFKIQGMLSLKQSEKALQDLQTALQVAGQNHFEQLKNEHINALDFEAERAKTAFQARRKAIEKVGLPEVRQYRLNQCQKEEKTWQAEMQKAKAIVPEIRSILCLEIVNQA